MTEAHEIKRAEIDRRLTEQFHTDVGLEFNADDDSRLFVSARLPGDVERTHLERSIRWSVFVGRTVDEVFAVARTIVETALAARCDPEDPALDG